VGQFLSFIEELPLHSVPKQEMCDAFNESRQNLYDNISGLVSATTATAEALAPAQAMEDVRQSAHSVVDAVDQLTLATKHLLAEIDMVDEDRMQDQMDSLEDQLRRQSDSSEFSLRPRRALSLTLTKYNELRKSLRASTASDDFKNKAKAVEQTLKRNPSTQMRLRSGTSVNRLIQKALSGQDNADDSKLSVSLPSTRVFNMLNADGAKLNHLMQKSPLSDDGDKENEVWFLGRDVDPKESVYTMEGSFKGGTLPAMVERLTLHNSFDADFMCAFLMTYRTFTHAEAVLGELTKRFLMPAPEGLAADEETLWQEKKMKPIRLRVVNVIKSWLDSYFYAEDAAILPQIRTFVTDIIKPSLSSAADQLLKLADRRSSTYCPCTSARWKGSRQSVGEPPSPILPRNLQQIRFMDIGSMELARQLTIMESRLYCNIESFEFLNKSWSEKGGHGSPNIRTMIKTANNITGWVADTILSEMDPKKRCLVMKHFVSIAEVRVLISTFYI
jgi:son of sevenless-like protein